VLGDQAYDGNAIRDLIEAQGAVPNIPAKSNRKWRPCFSQTLYRERNQVERFFSKLKHFRRIATRYDKLAENFLAMVKLASMHLWLRAYESTAWFLTSRSRPILPAPPRVMVMREQWPPARTRKLGSLPCLLNDLLAEADRAVTAAVQAVMNERKV
jgi:Transposase DDE domain